MTRLGFAAEDVEGIEMCIRDRGPLCLRANTMGSPWAWSRPCGPVPYAYGIIKVGRNATAFLGNAADRR